MTDTIITFTISEEKVQRVIDTMKELFSIPTTTDEKTGEVTNDFTDAQWVKESIRRWIVNSVNRRETYKAKEEININTDNDLIL